MGRRDEPHASFAVERGHADTDIREVEQVEQRRLDVSQTTGLTDQLEVRREADPDPAAECRGDGSAERGRADGHAAESLDFTVTLRPRVVRPRTQRRQRDEHDPFLHFYSPSAWTEGATGMPVRIPRKLERFATAGGNVDPQ